MSKENYKLVSTENIDKENLKELLELSLNIKNNINDYIKSEPLKGKILATIFYEPSTRTSSSFQAAMYKLGGKVINLDIQSSSVKKGETLEDTLKTMATYCDAIALRYNNILPKNFEIDVPFINAGDGSGEHPTQALLDIFTIYNEFGYIGFNKKHNRNMNITFLGDLKYSRTIHSLIKLLCLYQNITFTYASVDGLEMPIDIIEYVNKRNIHQICSNLEDCIQDADVLYCTRIQKERFENSDKELKNYLVNQELLNKALPDMIVMHPLPRCEEISRDIDNDFRACYFRQMENGLYARMALLHKILY